MLGRFYQFTTTVGICFDIFLIKMIIKRTTLSSNSSIILLQECGWETLEERRNKHKILLFHKMVNKTVPEYLSNLVPSSFGQTHQYRRMELNWINIRELFC
jgi:hypothetical protein